MVDDVDTSQARNLLQELQKQIMSLTCKINAATNRNPPLSTRGAMIQHRQLSILRRGLHEVRRVASR
ncbi:hypothetical protein [Mycolicibacterium sp.]|uniref:hypothetical protein n=1 Tax=Mycolicibacterium sp. TaxID=2320850 RepID=UPI001A324C76|nr:hypothetical protein [Mycolicibacterium sp.]MBJ7340973.1 hypothetical protein [Mycolicibacterium sp.]